MRGSKGISTVFFCGDEGADKKEQVDEYIPTTYKIVSKSKHSHSSFFALLCDSNGRNTEQHGITMIVFIRPSSINEYLLHTNYLYTY